MQRLVIPGVIAAPTQRLVDHPAAGLTLAHGGVKGGEFPARLGFGAQRGERARVRRVIGEIGQLMRVVFKVEELIWIERAAVVFPLAIAQRYERRIRGLGGIFHRDRRIARDPLPLRH